MEESGVFKVVAKDPGMKSLMKRKDFVPFVKETLVRSGGRCDGGGGGRRRCSPL